LRNSFVFVDSCAQLSKQDHRPNRGSIFWIVSRTGFDPISLLVQMGENFCNRSLFVGSPASRLEFAVIRIKVEEIT
jgi:hypothetical protein